MGKTRIVLCGGCDVTAICRYIKRTNNVKMIIHNSTKTWMNSISYYWAQYLDNIRIPDYQNYGVYYPNDDIFGSNVDVLVISLLGEIGEGIYKNKGNSSYLLFGFPNVDATKNPEFYAESTRIEDKHILEYIVNKCEYVGESSPSDIVDNYRKILSKINPRAKIYIILGPTFKSDFCEKNYYFQNVDGVEKNDCLNNAMINEFRDNKNVIFINPKKFYKKPKRRAQMYYYNYPSIRHYPRSTYFRIAIWLRRKNRSLKISYKEFFIFIKEQFRKKI